MISIVCRSVNRASFPLSSYRSRITRLLNLLEMQNCELSILLVDDDDIQALNLSYRQKDSATDVLSFPQLQSVCMESLWQSPALLGDIVLSVPTVERQAQKGCLPRLTLSLGSRDRSWSTLDEATFLTIHGLLPLLGYDHTTEEDAEDMERVEGQILRSLLCRGASLGSLKSLFA